MNESGPSENVERREPMGGLARFCFVAWIAATMLVYFLAFGTKYVVSLFRRIGLGSLGDWFHWLSDGLMTWFSAGGG